MDKKEEIIAKHIGNPSRLLREDVEKAMESYAQHLLSEKVSEWVAVETRLPEIGDLFSKEVLAYDGNSIKVVALFKHSDGRISGYNTRQEEYMRNVTHWQPLPSPPKQVS